MRVEDLVPSRLDVSAGHSSEGVGFGSYQVRYKGNYNSPGEWRHLVRYQVAQSRTGDFLARVEDLVPSRADVSASLSGEGGGLVSFQVRYKC